MRGRPDGRARASVLLADENYADDLLESCARKHLSLEATLQRFLPSTARRIGARSAIVRTRSEDLRQEVYRWGARPFLDPSRLPTERRIRREGGRFWVSCPLDVTGERVGTIAYRFEDAGLARRSAERVHILAEELDAVLWNIQTANRKQKLVERVTRALTRRVFREALDDAVSALSEAIPFRRLALLYIEESNFGRRTLRYRLYRGRRCTHDSHNRPHPEMEEAVESDGIALISPERHRVARVLDLSHTVETLFIFGVTRTEYLGQLTLSISGGLDSMGRDLLRVFADTVSQRLVDYRRERQHLSQHFSPAVINELLRHHDYSTRFLSPRRSEVAILYADINGFTRLCEKTLRRPSRIGDFIDHWSAGAVRIIWKYGGVFDKMTGDCVIAHFGPPFYRKTPAGRALAAVRAALEIQEFTRSLEDVPAYARMAKKAGVYGLGVAAGAHLCQAAVGFFGPHQHFTAFSSGMNETARLQSIGGFRETLVMEPMRRRLRRAPGLRFTGPMRTRVKNVGRPLRYYKVAETPKRRA